ncbi:Uncharacterised protein [Mycobacterium tuberculosis]|nr:Uncharacterised protein [Mycobacterium tuberculosis]
MTAAVANAAKSHTNLTTNATASSAKITGIGYLFSRSSSSAASINAAPAALKSSEVNRSRSGPYSRP